MKKLVCFILGISAFAVTVATAQMPSDTIPMHQLDEVNVVATGSQVASDALYTIISLSAAEIATLPVQTVNELLDYLPGVDVRTRGANGVQADISMRGGTFDEVLILLNGVNITDPQTGHASLDIPIELNMVERIEVLKGTSMNLFGLSAFSGAINIITNTTDKRLVKAAVTGDTYGSFAPNLGFNYSTRKWRFMASASYNQSNGYIKNTDYKYGNLFFQSGYRDSLLGNWDFQIGGQLKQFGANSFYSLKFPDQFEATKTLIAALRWNKHLGAFGLEASAFYRTHYDRFELFRENVAAFPSWYTGHNYHVTDVAGGNVKGAWYSRIGKLAVGVELRNEHIFSNVLGDSLKTPRQVPFAPDSIQFIFAKNRLNINYFAEQSFFVGNFSASIGFSGNYNTLFRHNFAFVANVGYAFTKNGSLCLNVNRALRLPTFTDLYYKSATQIANPELMPEESLTTEISLRWADYGLRTTFNVYYRMGQNIIDWVKTPEAEKWQSVNHTRIDAVGGEAEIGYRYGYWLKNIAVSYAYCHLNKNAGELMSKYALDYLKHKLTFNLEHGIYKGFGASWQLMYQNRTGNYLDINGATMAYTPVWLFDGRIYWKNPTINVFVEGSNLLGTHYYDYGGIEQPGRCIKAGICVNLKLNKKNSK